MSGISISDRDEQLFSDLRRHHLRHPGVVSPRVVKLFHQELVTIEQIAAARLEWLKLGLDKQKSRTP